MTKKERIIACFGHVNIQSIAKICNASLSYVANVLSENDLRARKRKQ